MIYDIIRNGFSISTLLSLSARVFVIFCVLPVHEFAHAFVAHKLGDDTARLSGRMTLNPLAHIDWIGALMMLLVGFGYAKPVPVNIRNFKKRKPYMAITAFAGPISNLLMALIFMFIFCGIAYSGSVMQGSVLYYIEIFLNYAFEINITLAVFNLIPIPPLDGSRLLGIIVPDRYYYKLMQYERYIIIGLFVLIAFGWLDTPISWLSGLVSNLLFKIASLPFGL